MKSIRRHLVIGLLSWLSLLCVIAVAAFVFASRRSLVAEFDRALIPELANARLLLRPGPLGFNSPANRGFDIYIQAWDSDTRNTLYKSSNLGRRSLPFREVNPRATIHWDADLENGEPVRIAGSGILTFTSTSASSPGNPIVIAVGRNRSRLEASVRRLTILASLTGGLGTLVAAGIALAVLDRGIGPLDRLGRKVDEIDSASLEARLSSDELAEELQPFARRINDLLDRLEAGFERERRFGADLSHELRTPLAEIRATAEMAKLYPDRASPEDYESILETTDRLERIVETQLALARSGLERQEAEFETIDIAAMTREVLHSLDPEVRNRELTLDLHLPPERAFTSHHELLETILVNLIENAVHHAPAGATIEVIVPPSPEAGLFRVRNPAPGLEPEDIGRIFERLWRKDASRTDRHHSGLGLSLARNCAQTLGFTLDAELDDGLLTMTLTGPEEST